MTDNLPDHFELVSTTHRLGLIAQTLERIDLERFILALDHAQGLAPFFVSDPTRGTVKLDVIRGFAAAAARFKDNAGVYLRRMSELETEATKALPPAETKGPE